MGMGVVLEMGVVLGGAGFLISCCTDNVPRHSFQNMEKVLFRCSLVARGDGILWDVKWPR